MSYRQPITDLLTHQVTNQPSPLENFNAFEADQALREGLRREAQNQGDDLARRMGEQVGGEQFMELGNLANQYPPELYAFDRYGQRVDEIKYHPAYHELMRFGFGLEIHSIPWRREAGFGHVLHSALIYLMTQVDAGVCCPLAMAYAAVPTLKKQPDIARQWLPGLMSSEYDPRSIPAAEKTGITMGMAMTEKQGGSDVRANTTRATACSGEGPGKEYRLRGHKWFCSAPMSDAFLTLAQTEQGLSCFLVPRWLADGSRNRLVIHRLKQKLGNRSNASAEIEYCDTGATMIGEDGNGIRNIIEMVDHTRIDAAASGAGLMRAALAQAIHHARQRKAFGKRLVDQPLMLNVLADLALEVEAATTLFLRIARAYDETETDAEAGLLRRIGTATAKYWINKRAPYVVSEALECLGGAGYIEESVLPRLYREAPLNGIWEGSGNVVCLDVLRALTRAPDTGAAFVAEIEQAKGLDSRLDLYLESTRQLLLSSPIEEAAARHTVEKMALCLQASLLLRYAPASVAEAFCATRLYNDWGHVFGTIPSGFSLKTIVERAAPVNAESA